MDPSAAKDREPFHWQTAIAYKTQDKIVIRGYDLNELIGNVTFTEMAYLVWRGELPSEAHAKMLDALLVSMAEHAFSPSSAACRFVASGGVPLHVGVAGGMLAIGSLHGTADRPLVERYWGSRARNAYPWRTLLDDGARLAFGSDAPVESPNPAFDLVDPALGLAQAVCEELL